MLILSVDTTSEHGGAALHRDLECLAQDARAVSSNYSVILFESVARLLETARLRLQDIEVFAVALGPGSFTGIRVGIAAVQGWALALRRPVVGVSAFQALVEAARPTTGWAAPVLDARRGEFYLAPFRRVSTARIKPPDADSKSLVGTDHGPTYEPAGEATIAKPEAIRRLLEKLRSPEDAGGAAAQGSVCDITCVARIHDQPVLRLRQELMGAYPWHTVDGTLLDAIARLAFAASREGRLQSPSELDAFYVRRTDAELQHGE